MLRKREDQELILEELLFYSLRMKNIDHLRHLFFSSVQENYREIYSKLSKRCTIPCLDIACNNPLAFIPTTISLVRHWRHIRYLRVPETIKHLLKRLTCQSLSIYANLVFTFYYAIWRLIQVGHESISVFKIENEFK